MIDPLSAAIRFRIVRLLLLHWQPAVIVEEVHCCSRTVYSILENLFMYSSSFKSQFRPKEILRKMFKTAENDLIVYLEEQPWIMQKEMIWYIWEKWGINMHRFTISRILKRRRWSNKKGQRVEVRQNDELRLNWIADMLRLTVEQLVFVDESLFNEITGWRHQAYALVDQSARYQASRTREHCWSVLSIYTKDEYLSCTGIREGWFNDEACEGVEDNRGSSTFGGMRASLRRRPGGGSSAGGDSSIGGGSSISGLWRLFSPSRRFPTPFGCSRGGEKII